VGDWPSSVVHYDRGMESVVAVHGHSGKTRILFVDEEEGPMGAPGELGS
jgi:hypothetical protein